MWYQLHPPISRSHGPQVLDVVEPKDKRNTSQREIEYLIHFQGWNASWDRLVGEEFVLKDSDEHRLLQKSLAHQSKLQMYETESFRPLQRVSKSSVSPCVCMFCSGAYLYRKDQKKPQRLRYSSISSRFRAKSSDEFSSTCSMTGGGRHGVRSGGSVDEQACYSGKIYQINKPFVLCGYEKNIHEFAEQQPPPSTSESTMDATQTNPYEQRIDTTADLSSPNCKITGDLNLIPRTVERPFDEATDTFGTSVDHGSGGGSGDDDRVYLHIGDLLKQHLERDWRQITQQQLLALPVAMPAITILENWVKHYSIKACTCPTQLDAPRRRSSSAKAEKREKDYEKLVRSIALRKEVADGLRIYLNYTIRDYLLYGPEREQAAYYMSEEYRTANVYVAPERQTLDMLSVSAKANAAGGSGDADDSQGGSATDMRDALPSTALTAAATLAAAETAEPTKRRLRSYKHDESEYILDIGVSGAGAGGKTGDKSR